MACNVLWYESGYGGRTAGQCLRASECYGRILRNTVDVTTSTAPIYTTNPTLNTAKQEKHYDDL